MKMLKFKKVLVLLVCVLATSLTALAQEISYEKLEAATKKPKGKFTTYISSRGAAYAVGDTVTIGHASSNKSFAFITAGDGIFLPIENLGAKAAGEDVQIKRMFISGTKRTGYQMTVVTKGFAGLYNYNINLENAIESKELKGFGMSSDEALEELKKAKSKLDLGLITTAKYEEIKAELIKYINL